MKEQREVLDSIALIGELEHIVRHARRNLALEGLTDGDRAFYAEVSRRATNLRRRYMAERFPDCPAELWCLGKATASLRQLTYEVPLNPKEFDELVDMVWGKITDQDLSGCVDCMNDKKGGKNENQAR